MESFINDILTSSVEILASTSSRLFIGSQFAYSSDTKVLYKLFDKVLQECLNNDNKSHRSILYSLLSQILSSKNGVTLYKKLNHFIDRCPSLLESCQTREEMTNLTDLIDNILQNISSDLVASVSRMIPRLSTSLCRLCASPSYSELALTMLSSLMNCAQRNLLLQSINQIRESITPLLEDLSLQVILSKVFAETYTFDSPENWQHAWIRGGMEMAALVTCVGIPVKLPSSAPMTHIEGYGMSKSLHVDRLFRGQCLVLSKMLDLGCASGSVTLDMTAVFAILQAILSIDLIINPADAKVSIDNEDGVSLLALSLIIPQLKASCLKLFESFLKTNHPCLIRYGSTICRLMSSIMSSKDMRELSCLSIPALQCLQLVICRYPSHMAKNPVYGINIIADMLHDTIQHIIASQAVNDILTQDHHGTTSAVRVHQPIPPTLIIEKAEMILLQCSSMLESSLRDRFEEIISHALVCMSKGIMYPQLPSRHVKRYQVELIRQDPVLQAAILSLAIIEVKAYKRSGMVSGNSAMLKRAATVCLHQHETNMIATSALLLIDRLTHPTHMMLPSIPSMIVAKNYLNQVDNYYDMMKNTGATEELSSMNAVEDKVDHQVYMSGRDVGEKRKHEQLVDDIPREESDPALEEHPDGCLRLDTVDRKSTIIETKAASIEAELVDGEEDDDILPDINIDSDNDD